MHLHLDEVARVCFSESKKCKWLWHCTVIVLEKYDSHKVRYLSLRPLIIGEDFVIPHFSKHDVCSALDACKKINLWY